MQELRARAWDATSQERLASASPAQMSGLTLGAGPSSPSGPRLPPAVFSKPEGRLPAGLGLKSPIRDKKTWCRFPGTF